MLGKLFQSKTETGQKERGHYCYYPSVLPEDTAVHAGMPKDEDAFDRFGHRLFREAYRIRSEDTFDLRYLTENQSLQKLQKLRIKLCRITQIIERFIRTEILQWVQYQEKML